MAAILVILTIGLPWLGAVLVWMVGWKRLQQFNWLKRPERWQHGLAVAFSAAAGLASLILLGYSSQATLIRLPMGAFFGDLTFVPNGLGVFLAAIAAVIGCLAVVFSVDYMHGDTQLSRYYFQVLFFIGAMVGLVLSGSLLFMFVFWEITALCSYGLISFYNDDARAVSGGIKALVITQLGGVGLLALALLSYAQFGSYEIDVFIEKLAAPRPPIHPTLLSAAAFGLLAAAAAKSAQVPFHTWLPDAMEAPTPVSALIHAATMVNAGVYVLARFYPAFSSIPYWKLAVTVVGVASLFIAAWMALVANDLKRVLAYSTISQLGYMVFAIGAGGLYASQFHLLSHAVFKALLFLGAGAVIHALQTRDLRKMGRSQADLPFVRLVFIIGALALAGLPILNGFWSKELVLEAGLHEGPRWAYLLALFSAGLTACYTFRVVWLTFYAPSASQPERNPHDAPLAMRTALAPLALGAVATWLLAGPLSRLLAPMFPGYIEIETTWELALTVLTAPATWSALLVIALGLAAWWGRERLAWLTHSAVARGFSAWAAAGFGFESINRWIVEQVQTAADQVAVLQTGQLNWNLVGFIAGLLAVLAWLAWVIY